LSEALNDYSKSIEIDDKDTDAYFMRGNLYFRLEQYDNAIKDFNIVLGLLPKFGGVPNIHEITKKMLQKANEMKHK
jgi:tetratricopeptide (TPR) repeat protein